MKTKLALILSLFLALPLAAAEKKALVGGTLINGLGSTPIRDSVILINGGTIEKVGTVDSLAVPAGYEVISTEAMSVMPGLWDMHVHLMINGHANYPHWHSAYLDRFAGEIMPASAVPSARRPASAAAGSGSMPTRPSGSRRRLHFVRIE